MAQSIEKLKQEILNLNEQQRKAFKEWCKRLDNRQNNENKMRKRLKENRDSELSEVCLYFRDMLREARARAFANAEGFQEILFTLERIGMTFWEPTNKKKGPALFDYKALIMEIAESSPLASSINSNNLIPASELFDLVKIARNDAMHQGANARHITTHAVQLSLILEDALLEKAMDNSEDKFLVRDFMVRNPVCAFLWQPLSLIRQVMLENSFSNLPLLKGSSWYLISDYQIANILRPISNNKRKELMVETLKDVIEEGSFDLLTRKAKIYSPNTKIKDILTDGPLKDPILVIDKDIGENKILGIMTAFDLL